jgi:hypothetical protein
MGSTARSRNTTFLNWSCNSRWQQRRTDILFMGSDADILAADDDATKARLALDCVGATVVELNRRLAEARATERKAAINGEYAAARAKVEVAVERI